MACCSTKQEQSVSILNIYSMIEIARRMGSECTVLHKDFGVLAEGSEMCAEASHWVSACFLSHNRGNIAQSSGRRLERKGCLLLVHSILPTPASKGTCDINSFTTMSPVNSGRDSPSPTLVRRVLA